MALEAVTPVVAGAPDDIDDQLRACVAYFEEAEEASQESRRLCERDRDYYDGEQWTTEELAVLRKRKQPALTVNKIKGKVEYLRGFERRSRSDPKAFPRTPKEEQLAEAATDALRFVGDQNDFDEVRSNVYESLLIEGTGAVDVTVEQSRNDQSKIVYKRVPYDRLWWDPHSIEKDFSDAKSKGVVIWMDATEAKHKWPDGKAAIEATTSASSFSGSFEDKPRNNIWCDSKRKRVRIVQAHYLWGDDWMVATFTKGGFLEEPMVSPYLNKDGNSASSLIMRSAYVDRDNNRYGDVRSQISLQDEINKRRSKALHLLSVRQTYGNSIALKDTQKAKNELAKPDGHVELNGGAKFGDDFGILPTGDLAQGQIALLQQATQEMHASGPNQALAGKGTEGQSGKAIQAQQLGGSVEIEPGLDDLRQWSRDVYEATWMRIKQFWTDEKWVRVTDDERNLKWVGLNQKVTLAEKLQEMPPEQAQAIAQQMGIQDPQDPRMQEVVEVRNDVSGLDVDIVIEEGPDITTLQSEQFDMLSNLAKSGIGIPPKAIIQASSIRNKDAILDEMEKGAQLPPEVQEKMAAAQEEMKRLSEELNATKQQLEQQTSVLNAAKSDNAIKGAELRLKERELSLKEREMTVKEQDGQVKAMALMQGDGLLEAQKSMADIALTRANTEQTQVETAILIDSTLNPEPAETEAENG